MQWVYDDGGRGAAGYQGKAGDCVCRSVAIASGRSYSEVYDTLSRGVVGERGFRARNYVRSARDGVTIQRKWFKDLMKEWGFRWVPAMGIGTGCRVHLTDGELPMGRLVVCVSRHLTAVIDGVIHDTYSPERNAVETSWDEKGVKTSRVRRRCVYGYWVYEGSV